MSDITLCTNNKCHLKEDCHRFTAKPNEYRQSYFAENPKLKQGDCEYFMSNKGYEKHIKKESDE